MPADPTPGHTDQNRTNVSNWLLSLWAFSRPHTIVGTTLSLVGLAIMAIALRAPTTRAAGPGAGASLVMILVALAPSLCANIYIVGLNQLTDIEIDRINKPRLPLASGAFTPAEATGIVATMGVAALALSLGHGAILLGTVALSMAIGTAYSLPPIRLKRFSFWAALCIVGVRGVVVNLGFYLHFRQALASTARQPLPTEGIPPEVWGLTAFVMLFALAIALFKDIPDLEGDRVFQIRTLTVRLGARAVFSLSRWVLTVSYGLLIALTLLGVLPAVQPAFLVLSHLPLGALVWVKSVGIDLRKRSEVSRYYQFIWKLFFLEYLLFPLACLLG